MWESCQLHPHGDPVRIGAEAFPIRAVGRGRGEYIYLRSCKLHIRVSDLQEDLTTSLGETLKGEMSV